MEHGKLGKIWAPWRIGYILGLNKAGCVFCDKAADSPEKDKENLILERGDDCYVLMNTFPYNPGHLLVCPYAHVANPEDLSEVVHAEMMRLAIKWKSLLAKVVQAHGFNLGINLGSIAGAGIAEHLHAHIVPRWQGDTNFMTTVSETRVLSQSLNELYIKLMENNY